MTDIGKELAEKVKKAFYAKMKANSESNRLKKAIGKGSTHCTDALDYADEVGNALEYAVKTVLSEESLPNGTLYYNIAKTIAETILGEAYDLGETAAKSVQKSINTSAGIGLNAASAGTKQERLQEVINYASGKKYSEVENDFLKKIQSIPQSAASDTFSANGNFQSRAGIQSKVRRTASAGCCAECAERAGEESYPGVDKIIFYRHKNCRCIVEYFPGNGTKQNVHTKTWTSAEEADKIVQRKMLETTNQKREEIRKALKLTNKNQVAIPARKTDTENLSFDAEHISERKHKATEQDAKKWIEEALFSVTAWNGEYTRYYSKNGAAYVEEKSGIIRTAYSREEYNENTKKAVEVLESG